jgi:thioredoxin-related protein/YHS domain-containing protein
MGKMSKSIGLLCVAIAMLLPPSVGVSQQVIQWEPSIENAQRLAGQTNRLVLIYFSGRSCVYCRRLESEVLNQPSVAAAINADYVAVKIVADDLPATARRYGITNLPTTVIVSPQGQVLDGKQGFVTSRDYVTRIGQVAAEMKRRREAIVAQIPSGGIPPAASQPIVNQPVMNQPAVAQTLPSNQPPIGMPGATMAPAMVNQPPANQPGIYQPMTAQTLPPGQPSFGAPGTTTAPAGIVGPAGSSPQDYVQSQRPIPGPPVVPQTAPQVDVFPPRQVAMQPPVDQPLNQPQNNVVMPATAGSPVFGLDGFCPVMLSEKQQWVKGDPRWGMRHRGRTYLFAGPEEQRRFNTDPDRYAPIASGNDIVLAAEQGQAVPGVREHGVFFGNRVYLFSTEASLERFARNPGAYVNPAMEALRAGANQPRPQWR